MNVPNQNLQSVLTQNQVIPSEGPRLVPLNLDFTAQAEYTLDAQLMQSLAQFPSMIQTVFLDMRNASVGNNLTMTCDESAQQIVATPGTQGYYNVLVPNPVKLKFAYAGGDVVIPIQLINVPIAGVVWSV